MMRKHILLIFILVLFAVKGNAETIQRVEAETCDEVSSGVRTETNTELSGGGNIGYIKNGNWIMYNEFEFNEYNNLFSFATSGTIGGYIELRLDSTDGTLIGTVTVTGTIGWSNYNMVSSVIEKTNGTHDLFFIFTGGDGYLFNIDYFEVHTNNPYAVNYSFSALSSYDSTGYVNSNIQGDSITEDTEITITAWGNYGYEFVQWVDKQGNYISSANPMSFKIFSDTIIKAEFKTGTILNEEPANTEGFANVAGRGIETTTGGKGGYIVVANTLDQLRNFATSSMPYVIIVNGHINAEPWTAIDVNSNKTIVGYGDDATLKNIELHLNNKQNIIIRNLKIRDSNIADDINGKDYDYDAIQADNCSHLWIDHNFLTNCNDGLIDLRFVSDYITVSWNHLSNHNKAFGIGWTDSTNYNITIHHNWIDKTNQRNPSFGNGNGHLFNNYLSDISSYGNFARGLAINVIQNSYYYNVPDPLLYDTDAILYSSGNQFDRCTGNKTGNVTEMPFDPEDFYKYTLDPTEEVKEKVTSGSGPQWFVGNEYVTLLPKNTLNISIAEGYGTVTPESGELLANGLIHLKAIAEPGWTFDHWSGDISGIIADTTIILKANKTIFAHFIEEKLLTISIEGNGTVSPVSGYYKPGETIQVSAKPKKGWIFNHWSGDISGTIADISITMDNNISVIANFIEDISSIINNDNKLNKFSCFYNATMRAIYIKTNESTTYNLELFSIDGSKVLKISDSDSVNKNISVNNLPNGVYILRIIFNNQLHTQRIAIY